MKLDVLVFASHPDDAEMSCGGTLIKLIAEGKKVGIVDLTRGELGTRGSAEIRDAEAKASAQVMGLHARHNLGFRDGFFGHDEAHLTDVVRQIRRFQPALILANAPSDRHPDHGKASRLVRDACFLSGLRRIQTKWEGEAQQEWRPTQCFYYIQDYRLTPSFVVDITPYYGHRLRAIQCFASQFYNPQSDEPESYISSEVFWKFLESRSRDVGHLVGVEFGEGFISDTPLKVGDPLDLL